MWRVLPHAPIAKLEDNLWCVEGELPGFAPARRMTVVRLSDGRLVIHSPIALEDAAMAELEAFGDVAFIVAPNGFHRIDVPAFAARYPAARVVCPAASRARVAQVARVDGDITELAGDPTLSVVPLADNKPGECALCVVHGDGGATVVLNDAVFNLPHQPGLAGLLLRLIGSSGGPKVTRVGRLLLVRDARAFADALRALAATEGLRRVVVSHGALIEHDAAGVLRTVADALHR
jgi:hypothetical protein